MVAFEFLKHTFCHSWEDISYASWKKYPSPERPDVISVDLINKCLDKETGILYTTRLVTVKTVMPLWIMKIIGGAKYAYFIEDSMIDPINKKMILKSTNISFNQLMIMEETCTYITHPENKKWTELKQEAKAIAFPYGISRQIEDFFLQKFRQNATKGREIMEQAIARIKQEAENLNAVEEIRARLK